MSVPDRAPADLGSLGSMALMEPEMTQYFPWDGHGLQKILKAWGLDLPLHFQWQSNPTCTPHPSWDHFLRELLRGEGIRHIDNKHNYILSIVQCDCGVLPIKGKKSRTLPQDYFMGRMERNSLKIIFFYFERWFFPKSPKIVSIFCYSVSLLLYKPPNAIWIGVFTA